MADKKQEVIGGRMADHDLLVQLNEGLKYLQNDVTDVKADIKELKDDTTQRVNALEKEKIDRAEVLKMKEDQDKKYDDQQEEIDSLKTRVSYAYGAIALAGFIIPLIVGIVAWFIGK